MTTLGLERDVTDPDVLAQSAARFGAAGIRLPTFAQLADPASALRDLESSLSEVDPDAADARNLFRIHWHNAADRRGLAEVPGYLELGPDVTGVRAPILVALGDRFPMIAAHKVLAAYGCLIPRLVTGRFDSAKHRAVWPSTGNYCRGGVALARILGCRGVAVLPEGMSAERFRWLEAWVQDPSDIVRTPGTESNVKEIYDKCAELARDPANVIFNQFCEFGNHLAHWRVTGPALARIFADARATRPHLRLVGFVSATGSAGTIGAGDYLKDEHGTRIVAAEALECPTLLYNGYGEHNIQGIGDKHVPLIHNVMNTDFVAGVSDASTDELFVLFNTDVGRRYLATDAGWSDDTIASFAHFGFSGLCNVLAAIKLARRLNLGPEDAVITVATDGAPLYTSEVERLANSRFRGRFDASAAARAYDRHLCGVDDDHLLELGPRERNRVFNLGYFTWVEQQGVPLADFEARRSQDFWRGLRPHVQLWDGLIDDFNRASGARLDA